VFLAPIPHTVPMPTYYKEQPMPTTDRERFIAADLIPDPTIRRIRFLDEMAADALCERAADGLEALCALYFLDHEDEDTIPVEVALLYEHIRNEPTYYGVDSDVLNDCGDDDEDEEGAA